MIRIALFVFVAFGLAASAGDFNKTISVGDDAPSWNELPGTDGKKHSLTDMKGKDVVVVVFTCCSCPTANDYESRIAAFTAKYCGPDGKVGLVAINVNAIKDDSPAEMKKRSEKKKYDYPFLYDESQEIARKYGANYTPEFFVLNSERKIVYMGAMDEKNPPAAGGTNFVEVAVVAALAGKSPETKETLGRGCRIRYVKK